MHTFQQELKKGGRINVDEKASVQDWIKQVYTVNNEVFNFFQTKKRCIRSRLTIDEKGSHISGTRR